MLAWLKTHLEACLVTGFVLFAVLVYASFSWGLPHMRFNSPDEAANAFFARRVAAGESLAVDSPLNAITYGTLIRPRSTVVANKKLLPASFLGLPVWGGTLARLAGSWILPYLTALGALIGLTCFYLLARELFNQRVAVLALTLLAFQPAYWYYHSRSMFHNGLFLDLLILAWWLVLKWRREPRVVTALLAGFAYGAAVSFRLSEAPWVAVALAVWCVTDPVLRSLKLLLTLGLGAALGLAPVLVAQAVIFGSVMSFGYPSPGAPGGANLGMLGMLFPFGFHPRTILSTLWQTIGLLQWWVAWPAVAGAAWLTLRWRALSQTVKAFCLQCLIAIMWLMALYGSLPLVVSPDPAAGVTLGEAHVRYYLPLSVCLALLTAVVLSIQTRWRFVTYTALVFTALLSYVLVVQEPYEGLAAVRAHVREFQATSEAVQVVVPLGGVIVSGIADKLFWPEREVIIQPMEPNHFRILRELVQQGTPVYYFQREPTPVELASYQREKLVPVGLGLALLPGTYQDYRLYQLQMLP